jgi:uncharacterized protein YigA (DUF484 family)
MKKMSKSAMVVLFCVLFVPFAATLYLVFFSAADATGFVQFIDTVIVPAIGEMADPSMCFLGFHCYNDQHLPCCILLS